MWKTEVVLQATVRHPCVGPEQVIERKFATSVASDVTANQFSVTSSGAAASLTPGGSEKHDVPESREHFGVA